MSMTKNPSVFELLLFSQNKQLLAAVRRDDANRTQRALDRGADIEYRSKVKPLETYSGENALNLTCRLGHARCVEMLLDRGADINALAPDGFTLLGPVCEAWTVILFHYKPRRYWAYDS
jgi:ankyrin repeat protein